MTYKVHRYSGSLLFDIVLVRKAHVGLSRTVGVRRLIRLRLIVAVETSPRQPYRLRVGSRHLFIDRVKFGRSDPKVTITSVLISHCAATISTLFFVPVILITSSLIEVVCSCAEYWVRIGINNRFVHINTELATLPVALSAVARARNKDLGSAARSYLPSHP